MAYKVKRNNNKKSTNTKKSKTTKASKQKNTENVWQRFINYFKNINWKDIIFNKNGVIHIIQSIIFIAWLCVLCFADCFISPYVLVFIAIMCATFYNLINKNKLEKHKVIVYIGSIIFALMIFLANYKLWLDNLEPGKGGIFLVHHNFDIVIMLILLLGSFFGMYQILKWTVNNKDKLTIKGQNEYFMKPILMFVLPFIGYLAVYGLILVSCKLPGNLSPDSIALAEWSQTGQLSNANPICHTLFVTTLCTLGQNLFGSLQAGVILHVVVQMTLVSASFAIVVFTLYQMNLKKLWIILVFLCFLIMPYHIMYSFTIWKDIIFGASVLLFCVFLFRIYEEIGKYQVLNYLMLALSGVVLCLFRHNGFYSFVFVTIVAIFLLWKKNKKILIIMGATVVFCFGFNQIVSMFVQTPNIANLQLVRSIPAQQITKSILTYNDLSQEEQELLNKVTDLSKLQSSYKVGNTDGIRTNDDAITQNKDALVKFYFNYGLRHPITYLTAFVDMNVGYWNAGYNYWWIWDKVTENEVGIERHVDSPQFNNMLTSYFDLYNTNPIFILFRSIGLFFWLFLYMLFVSIIKRKDVPILGLLLNIAIVGTIIITAPIFCEFRYAYSLFCCLPFIAIIVMRQRKPKEQTQD